MPMQAQTRLLRTLQTGRITRVGGHREIELDVRFVAATNKPFGPLIEAGLFREDLYYRINVVPIDLPPLRDRLSDIPALVDHFLALAVHEGLPRRSFDDGAIAAMQRRNWRGNVRELRNLVFRAVIMSRDDLITADALGGIFDEPALGGESSARGKRFRSGSQPFPAHRTTRTRRGL